MTIEERLEIYKEAYKFFNKWKWLPIFYHEYSGYCQYFNDRAKIKHLSYLNELWDIATIYGLNKKAFWFNAYNYFKRAKFLKDVIETCENEISIKLKLNDK